MATQVNVREIILETLLLITRDGEYSHIALKNVLDKYQYLEKRERAFITRVVEGTLERQIEIDYIINQFSKVKVNKQKPVIRTILRSSVYQLKYMDHVPDSAVCNEAVKLAGKKGFVNLKGFVNGVLRNISRNLDMVSYPDPSNEIACLSVRYSLEKDGVVYRRHPVLPYAYELTNYDYLAGLLAFQKGYFYIQDISSMQVAEWAEPKEGDYVIDVCAAPGGKAIHLAEKLSGTGYVEARDLTEYKVALIEENIERSGLDNIEAVCQDATINDEASYEKADILIADLPCSGLGILGKKPDLKSKMTVEMAKGLADLQRQILTVVHNYVKPGGKLLYSTCTINREENEDNTAWFVENFPEFEKIREKQMLPGSDMGDGFYIAEFRKQ